MVHQHGDIQSQENIEEITYSPPAIVYEGLITTRAGSPFSADDGKDSDPADLFGD